MTRERVVAMLLACAALVACDETQVRTGTSELTTLENDAMRVLVSPAGIGQLVEVANAEGFPLSAPSQPIALEGATGSLGPLEQVLGVTNRESSPGVGSVSLTTRIDAATVFVPIRVAIAGETRICRFRVESPRIETTASLVLVDGENGKEFGVSNTPLVVVETPVASPVTDCADLADVFPDDLDDVLATYVSDAVATSAALSLPSAPLEILGLLRGNVQLTKKSAFASRVGTLVVEADVSPRADALAISPDGLSISVDATAEANRARCAPPSPIQVETGAGALPLDPDAVRRFGADFAIALSESWLGRVAQGATLAGYACRGLEDARRPPVNTELVPTADVRLEEIGLDKVPVGAYVALSLAPGSLPEVHLQPDSGTIGVDWDDLQLEVYAEVLGAQTRLARVVADAQLGLGPTAQVVGVAKFQLDSIEVQTDRIDSEFLGTELAQEDLDRWVRRTLLNLLEERFEFPLPLAPEAPVRVLTVQVRTSDVVLFMRFD